MNWVKANWALIVAFFTMSVAWGQNQLKVEKLEDAIVQQAVINKALNETREQVIRQDERLKSIDKSQQNQEQLLRELLQSQRSIERKVSR
jgi:hypothetical protein